MKNKSFLLGFMGFILCSSAFGQNVFGADEDRDAQPNHVIYIQDLILNAGSAAALQVIMNDDEEAVGFQFDLFLPEGVTLAEESSLAISPGSIIDVKQHIFDTAILRNGACRVLCYSFQNKSFTLNSGDIASIKIIVDSNLPNGIYPIILKNVEVTRSNGLQCKKENEIEGLLSITDEDLDDITPVEVDKTINNRVIYNLMGIRVKKLYPGQIGIIDGKKIIVNSK